MDTSSASHPETDGLRDNRASLLWTGFWLSWALLLLPAIAVIQYARNETNQLQRILIPVVYLAAVLLWPLLMRPTLQFPRSLLRIGTALSARLSLAVLSFLLCSGAGLIFVLFVQNKAIGQAWTVRTSITALGLLFGTFPLLLRWDRGDWVVFRSWKKSAPVLAVPAAWFLGIGLIEQSTWQMRGLAETGLTVFALVLIVWLGRFKPDEKARRNHRLGLVMSVIIVLAGLLIFEGIFKAFPGLIPGYALHNLPQRGDHLKNDVFVYDGAPIQVGRRFQPGLDFWITGKAHEILVFNAPERFHSLNFDHVEPLRVRFITDSDGFRNPPGTPASVDIIVAGDSLTLGMEVQRPWPEMVSNAAGMSVYNLAIPGMGPQAESKAITIYGIEKDPSIVLMAYFEGNDLRDSAVYDKAQRSGLSLPELALADVSWDRRSVSLTWLRATAAGLAALLGFERQRSDTIPQPPVYPIRLTTGGREQELVFLDGYITLLGTDRTTIEASENFRLATAALLEARDASEAAGARFILVYVPTKENVYLPLLPNAQIDLLTVGVGQMRLENGFLEVDPDLPAPPAAEFKELLNSQVVAFREFALTNGIEFIDLTPRFQESAREGAALYLPLSIHMTELGHRLAAETVLEYLSLP